MMKSLKSLLFAVSMTLCLAGVCRAGIAIDDGLTRELTVRPGEKVEGRIVMHNTLDQPQHVKVYLTDYLFYADGKNIYGEAGKDPRSNASWITFAPQQFTIPAKDSASVYYSIQVPSDDKLTGTCWSILMVEPIPEGSLEPKETEPGKVTIGLRTVMRYGVQMVTHIGNTGKREIKIADRRLLKTDCKYSLQLDIENTGERWARPAAWAEIYDSAGQRIGKFEGERFRVFPGCSVRKTIGLTSLASGKYTALVLLDNGDESAWGAQYELEIK